MSALESARTAGQRNQPFLFLISFGNFEAIAFLFPPVATAFERLGAIAWGGGVESANKVEWSGHKIKKIRLYLTDIRKKPRKRAYIQYAKIVTKLYPPKPFFLRDLLVGRLLVRPVR